MNERGRWYATQPAQRATILFRVRDHHHHRSLVEELVRRARKARLAGATVFEGVEGYGRPGSIHERHPFVDDSPASVVLVDRADPMGELLRSNADLLAGLVIIVEDVELLDLASPPDPDR